VIKRAKYILLSARETKLETDPDRDGEKQNGVMLYYIIHSETEIEIEILLQDRN